MAEEISNMSENGERKESIYKQDAIDALAKAIPSLTTPDGRGDQQSVHIQSAKGNRISQSNTRKTDKSILAMGLTNQKCCRNT